METTASHKYTMNSLKAIAKAQMQGIITAREMAVIFTNYDGWKEVKLASSHIKK